MTNKKNARRGGETATGADQNPERNSIMNESTTTTDIHPGIAPILDALAALPEGQYLYLEPGDFGYAEHGDVWVRPASDFRTSVEKLRGDIRKGQLHSWGRWYRLDGTPIPREERPDYWMDAEYPSLGEGERKVPNAVALSAGGFLWVCDGTWLPVAETTVDGEPAFEFVTPPEALRRAREAEDLEVQAYLEEHADAIAVVCPRWADDLDVDVAGGVVMFRRQVGRADIWQTFAMVDGTLAAIDGPPTISVYDTSDMSPEAAVGVAEDLAKAARILLTGSLD